MDELWNKIREWARSIFHDSDMDTATQDVDYIQPAPTTEEEALNPPMEEKVLDDIIEETTENEEDQDSNSPIESEQLEEIEEIQTIGHEMNAKKEYLETGAKVEGGVPQYDPHEKHFEKLLSQTVDCIKYYDQLALQIEESDLKSCLEDFCRKLIENLILSGCTPIDTSEGVFDMTRHRVVPFQMVEDGTPYHKLVRAGVEWDGEVKVMAIVEL